MTNGLPRKLQSPQKWPSLSGALKIRIMLCLPCVFTTWANWHSSGILSPAPSLPWWQWQPTAAWHAQTTKHAKGYLQDLREVGRNRSMACRWDRYKIRGHHCAFHGHQPPQPELRIQRDFKWALKETILSWEEEIRFFEDSKFVSSKGLSVFSPTRTKNGLHSSVPRAYVLCPALTCSSQK